MIIIKGLVGFIYGCCSGAALVFAASKGILCNGRVFEQGAVAVAKDRNVRGM